MDSSFVHVNFTETDEDWISEENWQCIQDYKRSLSLGSNYIADRKRIEDDVRKMDRRRAAEKKSRRAK